MIKQPPSPETGEAAAPPRIWTQLYHSPQCCSGITTIAAYDRDPREVHDNGKPVYQYALVWSDGAAHEAAMRGVVEALEKGSGTLRSLSFAILKTLTRLRDGPHNLLMPPSLMQ